MLKLKRMAVIFPYGVITGIVRATSPGLSYMLIYLRRVAAQKRGSSLDLIRITRRSPRFYDQGILRDSADSGDFSFRENDSTSHRAIVLVDTTADLIEFKGHRSAGATMQRSHFLTRKDNLLKSGDHRYIHTKDERKRRPLQNKIFFNSTFLNIARLSLMERLLVEQFGFRGYHIFGEVARIELVRTEPPIEDLDRSNVGSFKLTRIVQGTACS